VIRWWTKAGRPLLSRVPLAAPPHSRRRWAWLVSARCTSADKAVRLRPREYLCSLRGIEIGRWQDRGPASCWPSPATPTARPLAGKEARDRHFGKCPHLDMRPALEDQANAAGYSVVDAVTSSLRIWGADPPYAWELLGRPRPALLDSLNESHPN